MRALEPYDVDYFDEKTHYTVQFERQQERLKALGTFTTACLRAGQSETRQVNHLYNVWLDHFVTHHAHLMELRMHPRLGTTFFGLQVFVELTRLFYLSQQPLMQLFPEHVPVSLEQDTKHPSWVVAFKSYDISDQYEEKEEQDTNVEDRLVRMKAVWSKDIAAMSQSETVMLTFYLSQMLATLQQPCVDEFRTIATALWHRMAVLMQEYHDETVLDEPTMRHVLGPNRCCANRTYMGLVSIYMGEVARRVYYLDNKRERILDLPRQEDGMRIFLLDMIRHMSSDVFRDVWLKTANKRYNFAGDKYWYAFYYPTGVYNLSECLLQLRPHLYRRYHSERNVQQSVIVNVDEHPEFVLDALDTYLSVQTQGAVKWHEAVVVYSHEIPLSAYNMTTNKCPLLVQVMATFLAYDQGHVARAATVTQALVHWFYLLRTRYNSTLHGVDLSFIKVAGGAQDGDVPFVL